MNIEHSGRVREVQAMLGNWNINAANEDLISALHVAAVQGSIFSVFRTRFREKSSTMSTIKMD